MVGRAAARSFHIEKYIDLTGSTCNYEDASKCRFVFLCLPTPTTDGTCDVGAIREAVRALCLHGFTGKIIIRSTVIPGTARKIMEEFGVKVVSNPEFLTERTWTQDADHPALVVIGSDNAEDGDAVQSLYDGRWRGIKIIRTDTITAETCKYGLNSFFSTKVIFANAIYDICQKTGANYETVKGCLESHPFGSKNHFTIWHEGGRGAGGKCLKKDLEAFAEFSGSDLLKLVHVLNIQLLEENPKEI